MELPPKRCSISVSAQDTGATALFASASKGYLAICETLLEHRAAADLAETHGATPLHRGEL